MRMKWIVTAAVIVGCALVSRAGVTMEYVSVGDPGNAAGVYGDGYGAVNYAYRIGKYEVTNAQYSQFLNSVAATDNHGLYEPSMAGGWNDIGGIERSGSAGSYVYSPRPGRGNRPVNYVSFWDACRFANWLHNGQPVGGQNLSTTEDGAYFLGGLTNPPNDGVHRQAGARTWIPSEDEWYKAAYYKGGGVNAGYWDYPTRSDAAPRGEAPPGALNGSANYWDGAYADPVYYTTEAGAYVHSSSPYGTFDQGGNLWEWNEAVVQETDRGIRGGSFDFLKTSLQAAYRNSNPPNELVIVGFRVATLVVPEPTTLSILVIGQLVLLRRRRK